MDEQIQAYIDKMGFTWTVESAKEQYEKHKNGEYVSFTARQIIDNVIKPFELLTRQQA